MIYDDGVPHIGIYTDERTDLEPEAPASDLIRQAILDAAGQLRGEGHARISAEAARRLRVQGHDVGRISPAVARGVLAGM